MTDTTTDKGRVTCKSKVKRLLTQRSPICGRCAYSLGAVSDGANTMRSGTCGFCYQTRAVTTPTDYSWDNSEYREVVRYVFD